MSNFLYSLGRASFRHKWRTIGIWVLIMAVLGGLAGTVHGDFDDEFAIPGAQSQQALDKLNMTFPQVGGTTATMIVIAPEGETFDDAKVRDAVGAATDRLEDLPAVSGAVEPWDKNVTGMISADDTAGIVSIRIDKPLAEVTEADKAALLKQGTLLQEALPGAQVSVGGEPFANNTPGMSITEVFGVGIALIVLLLTLGSLAAAGMPLLTALLGVGLTMAILFVCTGLAKINSTVPMLAVMLGLAVGIDYALFILSRHRELLAEGLEPEESAARSVATAGSAVVFAGLTVVIALVGLAVAKIPFLTSMGVFAAIGVAVAVVVALTLLPALMGLSGQRLRPRVSKRRAARPQSRRFSLAGWWAAVVTKVPALTIIVVAVLAILITLPARNLELALPNSGRNAIDQPDRITYDLVSEKFGPGFNGPLIVTADIIGSDDPLKVMDGIADDIKTMPGVASVPLSTPNENADTGFVQVVPTTGPDDPQTKRLVERLRAEAPHWQDEYDVSTAVTGATAVQIDVSDRLGAALLPFGIFVVGLSLVLLTMVFRSIAVPIKATLGYLLSIGVAFGATTMVFNYGWFGDLIHLDSAGPVISFLPILLMGILFGLAMDYEVFLVSRMREDHVHGKPAREAVRSGFVGSSRVVVAAAAIMFFVFAFFVPEGDGPIKSIAFALAVGVAFDAFVVRLTLVPAVMALLGERAWWLPRWLDRALPSFDIEGEGLQRRLDLSDWPQPNAPQLVYTEDLGVDGVFAGLSVGLLPGEVLVVEGPPAQRLGVLYALSGRLAATSGRGRVAGYLLNDQAGAVRSHTEIVDMGTAGAAGDLRRLVRSPKGVALVNGADALNSQTERDDLNALIGGITHGVRNPEAPERALVLGVADVNLVAPLLVGGYFTLNLSGGSAVSYVAPSQPENAFARRAEHPTELATQAAGGFAPRAGRGDEEN